MQSVKDAVQSLVDEKRVDTDKIGSGVFYWSFPSSHFLKVKYPLFMIVRSPNFIFIIVDTL